RQSLRDLSRHVRRRQRRPSGISSLVVFRSETQAMIHRPRRLRRSDAIRSMVRETRLAPENFVLPLFVCPGTGVRREISSMPGVYNLSIDETTKEVSAAYDVGVRSIILFGLPESKDTTASGAYAEDGI